MKSPKVAEFSNQPVIREEPSSSVAEPKTSSWKSTPAACVTHWKLPDGSSLATNASLPPADVSVKSPNVEVSLKRPETRDDPSLNDEMLMPLAEPTSLEPPALVTHTKFPSESSLATKTSRSLSDSRVISPKLVSWLK